MPPQATNSAAGNLGRTPRVLAAIITYNRIGLLQRSVGALRLQTRQAEAVLVVDNSSTDGTPVWLAEQGDLKVIRQPNSGSAGGTYCAAKYGFEEGYDWVWLMDDDTIPRPGALESLIASPAVCRPDTGFVYSLQVYSDGTVPRNDPGPTGPEEWALNILADRCIPVRRCSFVAMMVSRGALSKAGYPMKDMFFMGDDTEFSRRIVDSGYRGYCVLDSIVLHDTIPTSFDGRSWNPVKKRYASRNTIYLIRTSSDSRPRKAWYIGRMFQAELFRLFLGRSNMSVFAWMFRGFWFNPKVECPRPGS
jgi:rhamnopyranosyl-N-acetylglucosaminyl-diphospho-decaprenol beta-1,3/1,4-galactofuranosyltransferase